MHHRVLLRLAFLVVTLLLSERHVYAVDEDGDGMSDVWERLYGVPSSDAALDYDGDGMDSRAESAASTDPSDYSSVLTANLTVCTFPGSVLSIVNFFLVPRIGILTGRARLPRLPCVCSRGQF